MDQKLLEDIISSNMDACAISGTCQQVLEVFICTQEYCAKDATKFSFGIKSLYMCTRDTFMQTRLSSILHTHPMIGVSPMVMCSYSNT